MLALALDHAHERGLVHRDVKPENILFTGGLPCLADFGIARALEPVSGISTSTGIVRGTPMYMSPEQASADRTIDGRSDQYSLACVLYEMVAGIPPFVGPTAQSIIAQRFHAAPRPVRVVRGTTPPVLDDIIARAMSLSPVDRYPSAKAFADAIGAVEQQLASRSTAMDAVSPPAAHTRSKRWAIWVGTAAVVAGGAVAGAKAVARGRLGVPVDTTRIVVLPFQRDAGAPGAESELLMEALSAWRGVTVADGYQVNDAVAQLRHPVVTDEDARAIARSLRAGRYVRSRLTAFGDSVRLTSALYDAASDRPPYQLVMRIPGARIDEAAWYREVADSLILRGATDASRLGHAAGSRSAPAVQTFARGLAALDDWDLVTADSLFRQSLVFDPGYARAKLWLAQVKAWQEVRPWEPSAEPTWAMLARGALGDTADLSERERELGRALAALGASQFGDACAAYDTMRRRNDHDFAAWFGLGQCNSLDNGVVPDRASPTGYRYRRSFHQGVLAFLVAFEVLPSSHRGFERGAFESLQSLLYTRSTRLRTGYLVSNDTVHFGAQPAWRGDTLVFHPRPLEQMLRGASEDAGDRRLALQEQRNVFHRIARNWAAALPRSAGAKEALALSLDMLGDAAAVDSLVVARSLTTDSLHRLQLASLEVILRLKLAMTDRPGEAVVVRRLADSLMRSYPSPTGSYATWLSPIAPVLGDCALLSRLAKAGAVAETTPVAIPAYLVGESVALAGTSALGCGAATGAASLRQLIDRIATTPELAAQRGLAEQMVVAQTPTLLFPEDSAILRAVGARSSSYLVRAQVAALDGDRGAVERIIAPIRASRQRALGDGDATPDAILSESRTWLSLRDTATALATLDSAFAHARGYPPTLFMSDVAATAALIRMAALRAELAAARGDRATARRFAGVVTALWTKPGRELASEVAQLQAIAR